MATTGGINIASARGGAEGAGGSLADLQMLPLPPNPILNPTATPTPNLNPTATPTPSQAHSPTCRSYPYPYP
eukprot:scaffold54275_cov40-Phaeocystis_antarctica.AAC.1